MLKTLVKKLLLPAAFVFALPALAGSAENPHVLLQTSLGDIELELDATRAPLGVANFLAYVDSGFYDGTVFHRVIPGFMVQGGGFNQDMQQKPAQPPIKNESQNGLSNGRGSIAYARTANPHSATSQFYINLVDNPHLDARNGNPGYAVFGQVVRGMDVVDKIAQVPTEIRFGLPNVPKDNVLIISAKRVEPLPADGASLP